MRKRALHVATQATRKYGCSLSDVRESGRLNDNAGQGCPSGQPGLVLGAFRRKRESVTDFRAIFLLPAIVNQKIVSTFVPPKSD